MNSLTSLGYAHFISDTFSCRHEKLSLGVVWQATAQNWNKSLTHVARHAHVPEGMTDRFVELNPSPLSWIFTSGSAPLSYLFTSATVLTPVHITPKSGTEPIRYVTLNLRDQRGAALPPYKKRAEIAFLMCEQKPYISGMNFVPAWKLFCIVRT